jgi:hypothetical protein
MSHNEDKLTATVILLVCVIAVVVKLVYSQVAYGDWTCAFANCVKVKDVPR